MRRCHGGGQGAGDTLERSRHGDRPGADCGEEPARPGGEVSGKGIYRDLDDDKPGQDVARCEEAFSIKGTKRALTKADLEMNKAAVKRDFEFFGKKGCTLPMLGEGVHGANVEVTIPAQ